MMYWTKILHKAGITLWMCPVNERRRYNVTSSLIGWAHAQNAAWKGCIQTPLSSQLLCVLGGSQSDSLHEFKWLIHILPLSLLYRIQYQVISNNVIMALLYQHLQPTHYLYQHHTNHDATLKTAVLRHNSHPNHNNYAHPSPTIPPC